MVVLRGDVPVGNKGEERTGSWGPGESSLRQGCGVSGSLGMAEAPHAKSPKQGWDRSHCAQGAVCVEEGCETTTSFFYKWPFLVVPDFFGRGFLGKNPTTSVSLQEQQLLPRKKL